MAKGIMVVETGPASPAEEADYNEWYSGTHIPQICEIPGFLSARRFKLRDPDGSGAPSYLAVYELEADDLDEPLAELRTRSADGRMDPPRGVRMDPPPSITVYDLFD